MTTEGLWPAAMVLVLIAALAVLVASPAEAKKKGEPTHVTITKSQENRWTVDVAVTHPMLFREWYRGCARDPNPKGKCPTEYKFPLEAVSNNGDITFHVTWTKITQ